MRNPLPPFLVPAVFVALSGCQSLESVAPAVSPAMVAHTANGTTATLSEGRRLLTTRCINCHSLEPIADHSVAQWTEIMREMGPKARLSEAESRQVLAYLAGARATIP